MILVLTANSISTVLWAGITFELFNPDSLAVAVGSRLRCLYVQATQQFFALDLVA